MLWKIFSRIFMVFGIIEMIGSLLYFRGLYWNMFKEGLGVEFIISFLIQLLLGVVLYFLGDFMLRIQSEENTLKYVLQDYKK